MLINCDFERHGFKIDETGKYPNKLVYYTAQGFVTLHIETARKGCKKVELRIDDEHIATEMMWNPEQLRIFLLFHKVITHNEK